MTRKASRFKVGLFVLIGSLVALAGLIYFTAYKYFDNARTYVTFFNESVQGLQRDSVVKYLGVSVGRVKDIRVAPDYNLVEVVMDIRFEGDLSRNLVAQLRSAGITGITFIELTRRQSDEPDLSPRITFAAEYPIIPSKPSEITQIVSSVEKVTRQMAEIDFKGLAGRLHKLLDDSIALVGDQRLANALSHLESASKRLDTITEEALKRTRALEVKRLQAKLDRLLDHSDAVVKEAGGAALWARRTMERAHLLTEQGRKLLKDLRRELKAMRLARTAGEARRLIESLQHQADLLELQLRRAGNHLDRSSRRLDGVLMRLERNPSSLLFSQPPPPRQVR